MSRSENLRPIEITAATQSRETNLQSGQFFFLKIAWTKHASQTSYLYSQINWT